MLLDMFAIRCLCAATALIAIGCKRPHSETTYNSDQKPGIDTAYRTDYREAPVAADGSGEGSNRKPILIPRIAHEPGPIQTTQLNDVRSEVAGWLDYFGSLSFPSDQRELKKTFNEILGTSLSYPEPYRSTLFEHALNQLVDAIAANGVVNTDFLSSALGALKESGDYYSYQTTGLEKHLLRDLASASLTILTSVDQPQLGTKSPAQMKLDIFRAAASFGVSDDAMLEEYASRIRNPDLLNILYNEVAYRKSLASPAAAATFLLRAPKGLEIDPELSVKVFGAGIHEDPEGVSSAIAAADQSPIRDQAVLRLIERNAFDDPERSNMWVGMLSSQELKQKAKKIIDHPRNFSPSGLPELPPDNIVVRDEK